MDSIIKASQNSTERANQSGYSRKIAQEIVDICFNAGISLAATLPDDWIAHTIACFEQDSRFAHIPVNREESAIGICSGAFLSGTGSVALMGASGLMTLVYAITKINYTYEIPVFLMATYRGSLDDGAKFHVSNGLYLENVLNSINLPHTIINNVMELSKIEEAYHHSRKISRPTVVLLPKRLLQGKG